MKKIIASILALASAIGLTACGKKSEPIQSTVVKKEYNFKPIEVTGDNVLNSVRVFDTMYEDSEQAMFSPLSLNMCLGMLESGAAGESKTALQEYLGTEDYSSFAKEYLENAKNYSADDYDGYKNVFEIANSFWANKSLAFSNEYKKSVSENFNAEIDNLDFSKSKAAASKINGWVNEKTHKMIPTLVREEQLSEDTAAVLVNTVYFESAWNEEWGVPNKMETFTAADGSTNKVELMRKTCSSYYENDNATAFSCYYKNGLMFVGILPKETGDFTLESLDISSLLKNKNAAYEVYARMPKLNFESEFPLTDALKAAGLSDLFSPDTADFTSMQKNTDDKLFISEVLQKTKLELDDKGTKAAAATAVIMNEGMAIDEQPKETREVYLNRPFAFLIYDEGNEQIVFMGKVTKL